MPIVQESAADIPAISTSPPFLTLLLDLSALAIAWEQSLPDLLEQMHALVLRLCTAHAVTLTLVQEDYTLWDQTFVRPARSSTGVDA